MKNKLIFISIFIMLLFSSNSLLHAKEITPEGGSLRRGGVDILDEKGNWYNGKNVDKSKPVPKILVGRTRTNNDFINYSGFAYFNQKREIGYSTFDEAVDNNLDITLGGHGSVEGGGYGDNKSFKKGGAYIKGTGYGFNKNGIVNYDTGGEKLKNGKGVYSRGEYGYYSDVDRKINGVWYHFDTNAYTHKR